jgi:hypothetical protein
MQPSSMLPPSPFDEKGRMRQQQNGRYDMTDQALSFE